MNKFTTKNLRKIFQHTKLHVFVTPVQPRVFYTRMFTTVKVWVIALCFLVENCQVIHKINTQKIGNKE